MYVCLRLSVQFKGGNKQDNVLKPNTYWDFPQGQKQRY